MELIKKNSSGETYHAEKCKILYRYKGSISGDNEINPAEVIYFINGSAEVQIKDKKVIVNSPEKIIIPAKTFHKIIALTDISFVIFD
jgi:mannose-6-phosphate isomerase-like protein (cupin superfamily)